MSAREAKRLHEAPTVRDDAGLEHDHTARHRHNRHCVRITVRVDTDNVIQLICKHHRSTSRTAGG
jgi:hypothetical protein